MKRDGQDSRTRLTRGKCCSWDGRSRGRNWSGARSTLFLVASARSPENLKMPIVCPWTNSIAQRPRLYVGYNVTTPEHAHCSRTLIVSHEDSWKCPPPTLQGDPSKTASHPSIWVSDVWLSELLCVTAAVCAKCTSRIRVPHRPVEPSALQRLGYRLGRV
jgi:hypothetical protein